MKLSLAPVPYYWPRDVILAFYERIMSTPVDIVYIGETVCSKRRALGTEDWLALAEHLESSGKEVVISTLSLLEAESELNTLRRLCANGRFMVEANDIAAVNLLARAGPFVVGPTINIYNGNTLGILAGLGLKRWVMPVELGHDTLQDIQRTRPDGVETEIFVFGRLPLAISARCFTARHANLCKDECQFRCMDYPDGILLSTQEDQPFVTLNGVQLQSAQTYNLLSEIDDMAAMGVDVLRISPQSANTEKVIHLFYDYLAGAKPFDRVQRQLNELMPNGHCDGYWHARAGMESVFAVD